MNPESVSKFICAFYEKKTIATQKKLLRKKLFREQFLQCRKETNRRRFLTTNVTNDTNGAAGTELGKSNFIETRASKLFFEREQKLQGIGDFSRRKSVGGAAIVKEFRFEEMAARSRENVGRQIAERKPAVVGKIF